MRVVQRSGASKIGASSALDLRLRILSALGDPSLSMAAVADVIAADARLTADLSRQAGLELTHSAFYGYTRRIESVQQALRLVGLEEVRKLVVAGLVKELILKALPQRILSEPALRECAAAA